MIDSGVSDSLKWKETLLKAYKVYTYMVLMMIGMYVQKNP